MNTHLFKFEFISEGSGLMRKIPTKKHRQGDRTSVTEFSKYTRIYVVLQHYSCLQEIMNELYGSYPGEFA